MGHYTRSAAERSLKTYFALQFPMEVASHGTVFSLLTDEEKVSYVSGNFIKTHYSITWQSRLGPVLTICRGDKGLTVDSLLDFLIRSPFISEERLRLIRKGLEYYFAEDFAGAAHILVFQVEGIIRDLAKGIGLSGASKRGGALRQSSLDELLREKEINEIFGENFVSFLKTLYVDPLQENLRNNLAHGLVKLDEIEPRHVDLMILTLLRFCGFERGRKANTSG
jgi:hypothetical protein